MSKQTSLNSETHRLEIPNHGISTKVERCRCRASLSRLDPPVSDQTLQDSFSSRIYFTVARIDDEQSPNGRGRFYP